MTSALLAVLGVVLGVPVAFFLVWAVLELTGDSEEMGRVLPGRWKR